MPPIPRELIYFAVFVATALLGAGAALALAAPYLFHHLHLSWS